MTATAPLPFAPAAGFDRWQLPAHVAQAVWRGTEVGGTAARTVSTGYAGIAGAMGKHLYGGSLLITEHGIYSREREEEIIVAAWVQKSFKRLWIDYFKSLSVGAYRAADRIIALFETNRRIQIELGADPLYCEVISNGVNVEGFSNLPGKTAEEACRLNVGAVIRVTPIKDIKTMLYAFDIVKRRVPNAYFYLIGPTDEAPEYYQECIALWKELGIGDLQFTGRVNVKEYVGRMDVMVLTSISEGQPLALMEAMAAGVPVACSNTTALPEVAGDAALLFDPRVPAQISDAILRLASDERVRLQLIGAGLERAVTFADADRMVEEYWQLFRSVIASRA